MTEQLAQQANQAALVRPERERAQRRVAWSTLSSFLPMGVRGAGAPAHTDLTVASVLVASSWPSQPPSLNVGAVVGIEAGATVTIVDTETTVFIVRHHGPQGLQTGIEQAEVSDQKATSPIEGRITGPVRLIEGVARAWNLTNEELASLLDYSSPQLAEDLLRGRLTFSGSADRADRARILYSIHDTLSALFVDAADEARWIRAPVPALGGAAPITYMMERRIPGILAVWQLVEQHLANR